MCSNKEYCFKMIFLFLFVICYCVCGHETGVPRQTALKSCLLPTVPKYRLRSIHYPPCESTLNVTNSVPSGTMVKIGCRKDYKLVGDAVIGCINGRWTNKVGKCLKMCPPIYSTPFMTVTCQYDDNTERENCTEAIDGTVARFRCADFYEDLDVNRLPLHTCNQGKWSNKEPNCIPACGKQFKKKDSRLVASQGEYPWQTAIYNVTDKELVCSGSLINQRIVLTAAHCVTDSKGELLSKEFYIVAVGNYYRNFNDSRDFDEAQFSSIHQMFIPSHYKGDTQNYFGDIAVLITKEMFSLSRTVQPVCISWNSHENLQLKTKYGYVSGWGKKQSRDFKKLKVSFITDEKCSQELPNNNTQFLTDDKLCAGFSNSNFSVCKGDSGGGLVIKKENKRFYIVGIVSISPQTETEKRGCSSQQYGFYTNVSYYADTFISDQELKYRSSVPEDDKVTETTSTEKPLVPGTPKDSCILPGHPRFGKWIVYGKNKNFTPGIYIETGSILQLKCDKNTIINGNDLIVCNEGVWTSSLGTCSKICPERVSTPTMEITCVFQGGITKNCTDVVSGTVAKIQCAPFYEDISLTRHPVHVCKDGSWDQPIPKCAPTCGQPEFSSNLPWHVSVYEQNGAMLIWRCSGSLISQNLILTAAHCVTDGPTKLKPVGKYTVAVGKDCNRFSHSRDFNDAQISEVKNVFIPHTYGGDIHNYVGDIAVLVTKKQFTLSSRVQPVCVDYGQKYNLLDNNGYISNWDNSTENNKLLQISSESFAKCRQSLPEGLEMYIADDKMCTVFPPSYGDSGTGLMFEFDGRYYIKGISSFVLANEDDDENLQNEEYMLYTKVDSYINDFILEKASKFNS